METVSEVCTTRTVFLFSVPISSERLRFSSLVGCITQGWFYFLKFLQYAVCSIHPSSHHLSFHISERSSAGFRASPLLLSFGLCFSTFGLSGYPPGSLGMPFGDFGAIPAEHSLISVLFGTAVTSALTVRNA